MTRILAEQIYSEAERLGARLGPPRRLPKSLQDCPELIAELYRNFEWPKRRQYDAAKLKPVALRAVSFSVPQALPTDVTVPGAGNMRLFAFGITDGGNGILLLDGDDRQQADPKVYVLDHESPEDGLSSLGKLSKLLRQLQPCD